MPTELRKPQQVQDYDYWVGFATGAAFTFLVLLLIGMADHYWNIL